MVCRSAPKSRRRRAAITACRSSIFMPWTRTWSDWMDAWTFNFISLTAFAISLAWSVVRPWRIVMTCFTLPPTMPVSTAPYSSDFSETARLAARIWSMSMSVFRRNSFSVLIMIVLADFSRSTELMEPLKSKRWATSFFTCWTALSTSCRSTWLTISNEWSLDPMEPPALSGRVAAGQCEQIKPDHERPHERLGNNEQPERRDRLGHEIPESDRREGDEAEIDAVDDAHGPARRGHRLGYLEGVVEQAVEDDGPQR